MHSDVYNFTIYVKNSTWFNNIKNFSYCRKLLSDCIKQYGTIVNHSSNITNITPKAYEFPVNLFTDSLINGIHIKSNLEKAQRDTADILNSYLRHSKSKATA